MMEQERAGCRDVKIDFAVSRTRALSNEDVNIHDRHDFDARLQMPLFDVNELGGRLHP